MCDSDPEPMADPVSATTLDLDKIPTREDLLHHQGIMPTLQRHQPASCGRRRKTRNHRINCWATRWVPQAPTICQIRVNPSYHPQNWTKSRELFIQSVSRQWSRQKPH
ncbi:Uncharacterized protein APZ42_010530 [Daphnia magna]|uniref:Uncharacterized protein n=1 Tax=Daphnia magna TaxID=35525 RepID=A0A164DCN2_9CRUS|nr:Uncharacterized protein APZ42_010530 [Daphnia magna]